MDEQYKTLKASATAEIEEKHSRFIACAEPVTTQQQAIDFIKEIKNKNKEASHNVSAYYLRADGLSHSTDDGEPSGTAGKPVLEVLTRGAIFNAVIVVTRYFGGTLLGTGGLVRAYSGAASLAVEKAGIAVMRHCASYLITVDYSLYQPLQILLDSLGAVVDDTEFAADVTVGVTLLDEMGAVLCEKLSELTRGACTPEKVWDGYKAF